MSVAIVGVFRKVYQETRSSVARAARKRLVGQPGVSDLGRWQSTGLRAQARRWLSISAHRARGAVFSLSWWKRTALFLVFVVAIGTPLYQQSVKLGLLHSAGTLLAVFIKAAIFSSDRTMKLVRFKYLERKVLLYTLIKDLQRAPAMGAAERVRFQSDVLRLIASYVRSHRSDFSETEIYVNLIVEDGSDLVVLARDSNHRLPRARYPRASLAAARVF